MILLKINKENPLVILNTLVLYVTFKQAEIFLTCLCVFLLHSGPTSRGSSVYTKTPMYGSQTPMYGSRTPMYGSQTPTHGDGKVDLKERISVSKLRFVVVLICLFCGPHRKPHSSLWLNDTIPWSFTHSISRWSLGSNTTKYSRAKWRLRLQFWYFHPLPRGKFVLTVFSNYEGGYVSRLSGVLIFPPWRKKKVFFKASDMFFFPFSLGLRNTKPCHTRGVWRTIYS